MEIELKPCPFCGGKPEISKGYEGVETIFCTGCGIMSDGNYPTWTSRTEAAEKWNRRASPEPLTLPEIAGLVDACKANVEGEFLVEFVRAIEAAHGITEEK